MVRVAIITIVTTMAGLGGLQAPHRLRVNQDQAACRGTGRTKL